MHRVGARALVCAFTGAALAAAVPAHAAPPEDPGCQGAWIVAKNTYYGPQGASGNPHASAGPGYFLGTHTAQNIKAGRAEACP